MGKIDEKQNDANFFTQKRKEKKVNTDNLYIQFSDIFISTLIINIDVKQRNEKKKK